LNQSVRQRQGDRAREAGTAVYPCKDGYISMVAGRLGTAKAFDALIKWISEFDVAAGEELLGKQWQDFNYRRSDEGITRFDEIFGRFCKTRGKNELYHEGQARQIAIAPVNTIAELLENEQLVELDFFQKHFDPEIGREVTYPGSPYRLQRSPAVLHSAAPRSGEHNREIYIGEIGLTENELSALSAARII
jgi:benzylsuccinate CoA-transferase BbsE subunit